MYVLTAIERNATTIRSEINMAEDKNQDQNSNNGGANNSANNNEGGQGQNNNGKAPITVPKDRLDEEVQKRRELEQWKADREKADQEAESKRLAEQGKFKDLADKEKSRADALEQKYQHDVKVNALKLEAIKNGTLDVDAVVALAKVDDIKLSEDGSVDSSTVAAIIEQMKANKKYLFGDGNNNGGNNNANIGANGGAPNGGSNTTPTFKRSQLSDRKFYEDHRAEILQANREGKIIDDITPKS